MLSRDATMNLKTTYAGIAYIALAAAAATAANAQYSPAPQPPATGSATTIAATPGSTNLANYGDSKITLADFEASILRIPERDRLAWAMSQERVNKEVDTLLKIRTISEEAKRGGMDKDPAYKLRVQQYAERLLAEMMIARVEEEASGEFDQKQASFRERAREQYLVNKTQFQTPKEVNASHILVDTKARSADDALARIKDVRKRVMAGEPFEKLAEMESDDATAKQNKGKLGFFGPGQMDPAFEAAAYALKNPMEVSEPIRSQFGYHIIRLEEIKPSRQLTFEEAAPELMEKLKQQYVGTRQQQILGKYYDPSKVKWNEPAVVALKKTVDPAVYRQPEQR